MTMMMTSRARDKAGSGPAMQRTAVFSAAVLLLVMGTGLAVAAGAASSSRLSAPAVIASDRPVQRVPSTIASVTAGVAAPGSVSPPVPRTLRSNRQAGGGLAVLLGAAQASASNSSATKKRRKDDKRETVTPPVRDDDDR